MRFISIFLASFWVLSAAWAQVYEWKAEGNPVVRHKYTADPATLVYKDTLWIFAGEDFEGNQQRTHMENWCVRYDGFSALSGISRTVARR